MPCGCALLAYLGLSIFDGEARTIRFEINEWENRSWGFHSIDRSRTRCEVAIAADGSRHNRCESQAYRHYIIPSGEQQWHTLYLRTSNSAYQIYDDSRTAVGGKCECSWEPTRLSRADAECSEVTQVHLDAPKRLGTGEIAGQRVIRYGDVTDDGTTVELAFAPHQGCEVMEETRTHKGTWGIPAARRHYLVTSFITGPFGARLFKVPEGYSLQNPNTGVTRR